MTNCRKVIQMMLITQYQIDLLNDIKRKYCSMCSHEKNCWKPCATVIEYMNERRYAR